MEVLEGDEVHEHVGIFKAYSADFLQLLDVRFPCREAVSLTPQGCVDLEGLSFSFADGSLSVENHGQLPLLLQGLLSRGRGVAAKRGGGRRRAGGAAPGAGVRPGGQGADAGGAEAGPHGAPQPSGGAPPHRELPPRQPLRGSVRRGVDLGVALSGERQPEVREGRLRDELAQNPKNALAAANLAGLLMQRQEYPEAERWLRLALSLDDSLPDNGRRARMQLRELQRRAAQRAGAAAD
ncbi:MAG: hypothetical protein GX605_10160 [Chloroflexi bacterium]|nr:hypothetical protein [Chloroflexota bacterium]